MSAWSIWLAAAGCYVTFRLWYDNWRGPLTPAQVEDLMARMARTTSATHNDLAILRAFLAHDDGREFVMLNVVRVNPEKIPHPTTGELRPAAEVMQGYFNAFLPVLLRRAGHPAIVARRVGGYFDAWNVEPDPGWTLMGYMRYRSRRDMAELALDPRFNDVHGFKFAATPATFSFPTSPRLMLFVGPRIWLGLALALAAALGHLLLLTIARG